MTISIQTKRLLNGHHRLFVGDKIVGEAWRWPRRHDGSRPVGFGLSLDGVYWRDSGPNRKGGGTTTKASRLKDVVALAEKTLTELGLQ